MAKLLCYFILYLSSFLLLFSHVSPMSHRAVSLTQYCSINNTFVCQTLEALVYSSPQVQHVSLPFHNFDSDLHQLEFSVDFAQNGLIYVGGTDRLYSVQLQKDNSLNLIHSVVPQMNENNTQKDCHSLSGNQIRTVLSVGEYLIACGTCDCGQCHLYNSSDLSYFTEKLNHSDSDSLVAIISNNSGTYPYSTNCQPTEFMGFNLGHGSDSTTPFFFSKYLQLLINLKYMARNSSTNTYEFKYRISENNYTSGIELHKDLPPEYSIKILTVFSHNGFAYLLTVLNPSNLDKFETLLGRICITDRYFNSSDWPYRIYTEIPLTCESNSRAQTATLSHGNRTQDTILYVAFDNHPESSVCAFRMSTIEKHFLDTVERCATGKDNVELLPSYYKKKRFCRPSTNYKSVKKIDNRCGPVDYDRDHQYVLDRKVAVGQQIFTLKNDQITSLGALQLPQNNNSFLIMIGTADSRFLNILAEFDSSELSVKSSKVQSYIHFNQSQFGSFQSNPIFDEETETFYAFTTKNLLRISMRSCSVFTSSTACFYANYFECFWFETENRCLQIEEAKSIKILPEFDLFDNNTEIVYSTIEPTGWIVDLHGSNLNPNLPYHVMLNNYSCILLDHEKYSTNHTQLRCRVETGNVPQENFWNKEMNLIVQLGGVINETLGEVVLRQEPVSMSYLPVLLATGIGLLIIIVAAITIYIKWPVSSKMDFFELR